MIAVTAWLAHPRMHLVRLSGPEQLDRTRRGNALRQEATALCGRPVRAALQRLRNHGRDDVLLSSAFPGGHSAGSYCQTCLRRLRPEDGIEVVTDTSTPGPAALAGMFRL